MHVHPFDGGGPSLGRPGCSYARLLTAVRAREARCDVVVTKLGRSLNVFVFRLLETETPPELACVHACTLVRRERPPRSGDLVLLFLRTAAARTVVHATALPHSTQKRVRDHEST